MLTFIKIVNIIFYCFVMKELELSTNALKPILTQKIKVQPRENTKQQENKSARTQKKLNESQSQLSSNAIKHKLPEIILKYIIEKAKQKEGDNPSNKNKSDNKFMKIASKITQSKKMQDKYLVFKCEICQLEKPEREKQSIAGCEHYYCASCLHQYVIFKISSFQEVQCPNEGCKKLLNQSSKIYLELPLETRKKYDKLKQYSETLKRPGLKLCPNEQCDGFLELKQPQNQRDILITNPSCQKCHKVYCSQCLFEQHEGLCDPHQLTFFQETLHYRQCQKCKKIIQKSSGCNHMTCLCGYQFCYLCGKKWSSTHVCNSPEGTAMLNQDDCCCSAECCQCCDNCCQNFQECVGNCCDCICEGCCNPILQRCDHMCTCDCQCCQSECCKNIWKVVYILIIIGFILPSILMLFVFLLCSKIFFGFVFGIFGFPCLLEQFEIDVTWVHVVIGIFILPITFIFFIFLGFRYTFNEQGTNQLMEVAALPCQVMRSACNQ